MHGLELSTSSVTPSQAVVEAVAATTGVDPLALEPPLYDVVDPEALDTLLESGGTAVSFEYDGHAVRVEETGRVYVDGTAFEPGHGAAAGP